MRRRRVLGAGALAPAALLLAGCQGQLSDVRFRSWRSAAEAVLALRFRTPQVRGNAWNLAQVLQHLAQSIEYSLSGYPQPKPAWFRASVGAAAFATFDSVGGMTHDRSEAIPGAPALQAELSLRDAVQRLLDAMAAFQAHTGPLQPHFAYGALSHAQYQRAHLMHLAHHWEQFQSPAAG
jgi:hypothetical protein